MVVYIMDIPQAKRKYRTEEEFERAFEEGFGCRFEKDGRLLKIGTGERVVLEQQEKYNELGTLVNDYVQFKLVQDHGLLETWIPEGGENQCNIFISQDWWSNADKALVIIQGTGQVKAGIWSRSVCINENLELGSMLPYVAKAIEEKFAVVILNPNFNKDEVRNKLIPLNENRITHSYYVWRNFVQKCPASNLAILAHSLGGYCTTELIKGFWQDFVRRVKAIAFTDACIGSSLNFRKSQREFLRVKAVNWVTAKEPLDTKINKRSMCTSVSAGHEKHEYTSGTAFSVVFPFFEELIHNNRNYYI